MSKYTAIFEGAAQSSHEAGEGEDGAKGGCDAVSCSEAVVTVPQDSSPASTSSTAPGRHRLIHRRRDGLKGVSAELSQPAVEKPLTAASALPSSSSSSVALASDLDEGTAPTGRAVKNNKEQEGADGKVKNADTRPVLGNASESSSSPAPDFSAAAAIEEEREVEAVNDDAMDADVSSNSAAAAAAAAASTSLLFSCDMCAFCVTTSYEALIRHALEQHGDTLADYARLRRVAEKLLPVWPQVLERKKQVARLWGEKIFSVAVQRDAGAAKMMEAHRARAQLEIVVQRWHPHAKVFIFGSSVAFGVWDGISDIDFTIVDVDELEAGLWPPSEKNAVRSITELLRRAGFSFINLEPISHARVPIIKHHASLPIRLTDEQRQRLHEEARLAADARPSESSPSPELRGSEGEKAEEVQTEPPTQLEAELIIARSVRYSLNMPASAADSAILEASIRMAVGSAAVQQVWWNRTRDMCCMTFDETTSAIRAATCPLHFFSAGMRARVQPLHEECRPELYGMDFDLSFRAFGIRNSHLLRRYLLSHPCARPGALVLKDWSKTSGVNNSMNGYLTSYAINIMWIYFLVHRGIIPYVCPVRDVPASLRHNVDADPPYAAMVDPAWTPEGLAAMQLQAGELLLDFFFYYAFEFDWAHHVVSLNRPGVTTKASLGWDVEDVTPMGTPLPLQSPAALRGGSPPLGGPHAAAEGNSASPLSPYAMQDGGGGVAARRSRATTRYSFCIEDPYEENLNLGRHMGVTKTLRVQTELYRGLLSLLKDDVQHCCVFAASAHAADRSDVRGDSGSSGTVHGGGEAVEAEAEAVVNAHAGAGEPTELPVRVLYRLMAVSTRELALARRRHNTAPSEASASSSTSGTASTSEFPGIPLQSLLDAFKAQAPTEWRLATRVWNVHQLLHRLGLKVHNNRYALPRREVGVRRLATRVPPGVVPANAPEPSIAVGDDVAAATGAINGELAVAPSARTTADVAAQNAALLRSLPARRLPEDLLRAVTQGYSCLTPPWIAWSKPWVALSAWWTDQQHRGEAASGYRQEGSGAPNMHQSPPSAVSANCHRLGAVPEPAVGAIRQTGPQLQLHPVGHLPRWPAPARATPQMSGVPCKASARRVLRQLFRR